MREFIIGANDAGQRLDKFIGKAVPTLPVSLMYRYLRTGHIKVGGKKRAGGVKLSEGDVVRMFIGDEFFDTPKERTFMLVPDSLNVVYEDENILVADKPAGLLTHEDDSGCIDTLIARIKKYLYNRGAYDPDKEQSFVPALCNRLDRNTGGLVLAAKNAESLRILNQKLKDGQIDKFYQATVHGTLTKKSGTLTFYLVKDEDKNLVTVHEKPVPGGRTAVTQYTVIKEEDGMSVLDIKLLTGRTHQIRASFAHIGHPLCGDTKYGTNARNKSTGTRWQALTAYKLVFNFTGDSGRLEYLSGITVERG